MGTFEDLGLSYSTVTMLVGLFLAGAAILAVLGVIFHVLRAAGICDMSSSLGIKNPWYSFVPVLDAYAFGRLSARGKKSAVSVVYAVIELIFWGLAAAVAVTAVFGWIDLLFAADKALAAGKELSAADFSVISKIILPMFLLGIVAVARKVFSAICAYKVFKIFKPNLAVVFTVISVVLSVALPILLFSVRNNSPFDRKESDDARRSGFSIE